jgi:hypothetical protein
MSKKIVAGAVIVLGVVSLLVVLALVIFTPLPRQQVPAVSTTRIPTLTSIPSATPVRSIPALTSVPGGDLPAADAFVTVSDGKFTLAGRPYYFVGTNFWQGMNMGVNGPGGNRDQLVKELDHLQRLGVTNLRVMASSEGPDTEPYRMVPALMTSPGEYNESVFDGLDFFLTEMGHLSGYLQS